MCTIAILVHVADAPLVIAANRDELYARPTRAPERLADGIAGGVDELSGGTWLAIRRDGRFAAVTNQRALDTPPPGLRSRGLAVRELAAAADPDAYAASIDPSRYASMNLVWGSAARVSVGYFRRDSGQMSIEVLPPGVHVLCNDRLGAPDFPRGERLRAKIDAALARSTALAELVPALERALGDRERSAPADVPRSDRLPPKLARELTAICIRSPLYGTRSATVAAFAGRDLRPAGSAAAGRRGSDDGRDLRPAGSAAEGRRGSDDGGHVLVYDHADGPPDVTPFVDRRELLA